MFNNKRWSSKYDVDEGGETILYSVRDVGKLSSIWTNTAKKSHFPVAKIDKGSVVKMLKNLSH